METSLYALILYFIVLVAICYRIIIDTTTSSKAIAYLLLVLTFPVLGIVFYLSFGVNYRKKKLYQKKIDIDEQAFPQLLQRINRYSFEALARNKDYLGNFYPLASLNKERTLLSDNNSVRLLINGEEKFKDMLDSLRHARHHIHIEYYIYEDDEIGRQVAAILMDKAREGVQVRFIYDDFGSRGIRKHMVKQLREAGVEVYPFYEIRFILFASRMNYRNHRKIIVVDGIIGYVGGINIADEYTNHPPKQLYWRDTHLRIEGCAVLNLQFIFLTDWNFCARQNVPFSMSYFPFSGNEPEFGNRFVQIIASGPDSDYPSIMYSLMQAILLAKERIYITTPYFIPEKSFIDALKIAALSGVDVKLLVPGVSDSWVVNTTSQSYYEELLIAGVKIYRYNKGFVHAKTMVADDRVSIVGTTNLDNRSFDLNFEINAIVYDNAIAKQMMEQFAIDLENSEEVVLPIWEKRPASTKAIEKVLQLFSPVL